MFENKTTSNGVYYSRYIASWLKAGGEQADKYAFRDWLDSLGYLTDEEINDITFLKENGRLELETSVRKFVKDVLNK